MSMAPSLRKARELHHMSLWLPRLCECVCGARGPGLSVLLHVSWCVCLYAGVCMQAGAHAGGSDTAPSLHGGPQMLRRLLWTACPSPLLQSP